MSSTAGSNPRPSLSGLADELSGAPPGRIVRRALEVFGEDLVIAFSGAEDVLLLEYAKQSGLAFRVVALDTGRLHPETYRYYDRIEQHYRLRFEYFFPDAEAVERLVRNKGLFSFFSDGHHECCRIRKVEPLHRALGTARAWMTGQRRDQAPTRSALEVIEVSPTPPGRDGHPLVKFNPLAECSAQYVWSAIAGFEIPHNELHDRGYRSIGCEPCTRPILPYQDEREGRWWWEEADQKECGLHRNPAQNQKGPR